MCHFRMALCVRLVMERMKGQRRADAIEQVLKNGKSKMNF